MPIIRIVINVMQQKLAQKYNFNIKQKNTLSYNQQHSQNYQKSKYYQQKTQMSDSINNSNQRNPQRPITRSRSRNDDDRRRIVQHQLRGHNNDNQQQQILPRQILNQQETILLEEEHMFENIFDSSPVNQLPERQRQNLLIALANDSNRYHDIRIINDQQLQVQLGNLSFQKPYQSNQNPAFIQQSPQAQKQITFQKIIINAVVWQKHVNSLFDYQQKNRIIKTTLVIQQNVKYYINFVNDPICPPKQNDCFIIIYKNKIDKSLSYESCLLKDINMKKLIYETVSLATKGKDRNFMAQKKQQNDFKEVKNFNSNNDDSIQKKAQPSQQVENTHQQQQTINPQLHTHRPRSHLNEYHPNTTINKIHPSQHLIQQQYQPQQQPKYQANQQPICFLKLIMNTKTNKFSIKVLSLQQLYNNKNIIQQQTYQQQQSDTDFMRNSVNILAEGQQRAMNNMQGFYEQKIQMENKKQNKVKFLNDSDRRVKSNKENFQTMFNSVRNSYNAERQKQKMNQNNQQLLQNNNNGVYIDNQKLNSNGLLDNNYRPNNQPQNQANVSNVISHNKPPSRNNSNQLHQPYFIVRSLYHKSQQKNPNLNRGYRISPGDLIKLGKVEFRVMSIDGNTLEDDPINNQFDRRAVEVTEIAQQKLKEIQCKYCLGGYQDNSCNNVNQSNDGPNGKDKNEQQNFFVHLCDCRGHIGYVHYNCLTTWTTTKASIQTSLNVKMYFLQKMKCQVCTKQFPKYIRYKSKLYHLFPIQLPKKHLLLMDVSQKQDAISVVIDGDRLNQGQEILIGRSRNAALRVNDITVSRQHSKICKYDGEYYVKDCKSKFGTIVRSSVEELDIQLQRKRGFQINNTIFTIQVIKREVEMIRNVLQGLKSSIYLDNGCHVQQQKNDNRIVIQEEQKNIYKLLQNANQQAIQLQNNNETANLLPKPEMQRKLTTLTKSSPAYKEFFQKLRQQQREQNKKQSQKQKQLKKQERNKQKIQPNKKQKSRQIKSQNQNLKYLQKQQRSKDQVNIYNPFTKQYQYVFVSERIQQAISNPQKNQAPQKQAKDDVQPQLSDYQKTIHISEIVKNYGSNSQYDLKNDQKPKKQQQQEENTRSNSQSRSLPISLKKQFFINRISLQNLVMDEYQRINLQNGKQIDDPTKVDNKLARNVQKQKKIKKKPIPKKQKQLKIVTEQQNQYYKLEENQSDKQDRQTNNKQARQKRNQRLNK